MLGHLLWTYSGHTLDITRGHYHDCLVMLNILIFTVLPPQCTNVKSLLLGIPRQDVLLSESGLGLN